MHRLTLARCPVRATRTLGTSRVHPPSIFPWPATRTISKALAAPLLIGPGTSEGHRPFFMPLFTGVRGRGILRSSVILGAFPTIGVTAPVGSVGKGEQTYAIR